MTQREVCYKRDMSRNYLILPKECSSYQVEMFCRNDIKGLLKGRLKCTDGEEKLYYDISSRQSLSTVYEKNNICFSDVKNLFYSWTDAVKEAERYLLNTGFLVCSPEFIYLDPSSKRADWLFYPTDCETDYPEDLSDLAEFLLEKVDHKDADAVDIIYKFYRSQKEGTFLISEMIEMIEAVKTRFGDTEPLEEHEEYIREEFQADFKEPENEVSGSVFQKIGKLFSLKGNGRMGGEKEENHYKKREQYNNPVKEKEMKEKEMREKEDRDLYEPGGVVWQESKTEEKCNNETVLIAAKPEEARELKCIRDGKTYSLKELPVILGKMKGEVDICIEDESVSRMHVRFFESDRKIMMEDLNSKNGSSVNDIDLESHEKVVLCPGDRIRIGLVEFVYN